MTGLQNVLLDLDGTLTDPKPGITRCIQYALSRLGFDPPSGDSLEWCIGPPLKDSFARLLDSSDPVLLAEALVHYRKRFSETGIFENAVYDGIPDALDQIRQAEYRLYLATSKPRIYADRILDFFSLTHFFQGVYGSELDGTRTDKTILVGYLIDLECLDPGASLMVGDRKHDIIGGRGNGTRTAAVTWGYGSRDELSASSPDFVFDSPSALAEFLLDERKNRGSTAAQ